MPAFRFYDPAPVFLDLLGLAPISGGFLWFYDLGTTTPLDTWSDEDLVTLNENPVPLDSAGRSNTNIFLDGSYTVVCKNAGGETVWTRDVIPGGGAGQTIPALVDGQFLANDGTNLVWAPVRQMPDPTGSTGQYLVTDGAGYVLTNIPSAAVPVDPDIVVTTTPNRSFRAGVSDDESKFYMQCGIATAPATGQLSSSVAVTFPEPFDELWTVIPTILVAGVSSLTPPGLPSWGVTGFTPGAASTDVTVNFRIATDAGSGTSNNINNPVPFAWVAIGIKTVAVTP